MRRSPHRGQNPRPFHEKRRSSPQAVHRNRASRRPDIRTARSRGTPVRQVRKPAVPQRRGVHTEGLEMVPRDPVQDGRCRIARFGCARWLRHAQATGGPHGNTRDRSIRRECRDDVREVARLSTVVGAVFRWIRTAGCIAGHLFGVGVRSGRTTHRAPNVTVLSTTAGGRRGSETSHGMTPFHIECQGVCRMAGDESTSDPRRAGGVKGGGAAEGHR
jgi:hypothetical protein